MVATGVGVCVSAKIAGVEEGDAVDVETTVVVAVADDGLGDSSAPSDELEQAAITTASTINARAPTLAMPGRVAGSRDPCGITTEPRFSSLIPVDPGSRQKGRGPWPPIRVVTVLR